MIMRGKQGGHGLKSSYQKQDYQVNAVADDPPSRVRDVKMDSPAAVMFRSVFCQAVTLFSQSIKRFCVIAIGVVGTGIGGDSGIKEFMGLGRIDM